MAHVDTARACLNQLPRRIVRERRDEVDAELTARAKSWDPGTADFLARHLLEAMVPEKADRYDENAHERRHLGVVTDQTGMVLLKGQLDPAAGLTFVATLDHLVAQDRAAASTAAAEQGDAYGAGQGSGGGAVETVPDVRTRGQRRADALTQMAGIAAQYLGLTPTQPATDEPAGTEPAQSEVAETERATTDPATTDPATTEPTQPGQPGQPGCGCPQPAPRPSRAVPRVVVVVTPDQLAGLPGAGAAVTTSGDLISHGTLTRLTCDATIDRVVLAPEGRALAIDTLGRLATPTQQTALAARDHGCTWPGCTAPPSLCEAHHVIWWSRGGPTTLDNLALLCQRHHTQIHAQDQDGWVMLMRDGLPWFRPPDRLDPTVALRRNTFHQAVTAARATGVRWRTPATPATAHDPDPP